MAGNQNPLTNYSQSTAPPEMSVDGLTINKRYAFTGVVNTLQQSNTKNKSKKIGTPYSAPQLGQANPPAVIQLPNQAAPASSWSSPQGVLGSSTIIGIQINLNVAAGTNSPVNSQTQQTVFLNYVSFEMEDVPANWSMYYLDPISNLMIQLTDVYGNPVGGKTTGQNPGSWNFIEVYAQTISTSLLELRLDRNVSINLPPSSTNSGQVFSQPYSFTLSNMDIRLLAENDFGQVPQNAVLSSVNSLGITEQYVKVQRDSSQIQAPANRTQALASNAYWRSDPQPVGDAVVCLYVDMGSKQTIDSMYLDPLYSGIDCNLYYSNDDTVNNMFWCSRNQTTLFQMDQNNPVAFQQSGEQLWGPFGSIRTGAVFSGKITPNSGLLAPGNLQIDGTSSWAMGLKFTPSSYILSSSATLYPGQELSSPSGNYVAVMQPDGNFVVYPNDGTYSNPLWQSNTAGNNGATLAMQSDGNLTIYAMNGTQIWDVESTGTGNYLKLLDTGELQIVGQNSTIYWRTNTTGSSPAAYVSGTLLNQVLPGSQTNTVRLTYSIYNNITTFTAIINGQPISYSVANSFLPTTGWPTAPYTIMFGYDESDPTNPYVFLYIGAYDQQVFSVKESITIDNNTPFVYDGESGPDQGFGIGAPGVISLGNDINGGNPGNGIVQDFWIRQDSITDAIFNAFVSHSRPFIDSYGAKLSSTGVPNTLRGDYKALLLARLNNNNVNSGPSAEYYEQKTWTPLQADLKLRKATYTIPEIQARYIKLEFTNLKSENYPLTEKSVTRTVKFFPPEVLSQFQIIESNNPGYTQNNYIGLGTNGVPSTIQLPTGKINVPTTQGSTYQQFLNTPTQGQLNSSIQNVSSTTLQNSYTAVTDPSSTLALSNGTTTDVQTAKPSLVPRFTTVGVHNYYETKIVQTWQQAYFVGLKAMQFYKRSQTTVDDTEYYYDSCSNPPGAMTSNANTSIFDSAVPSGKTIIPWNSETSGNTVSGYQATASGQVIYTLPLSSFSRVSSFQMATVASDWKSLQSPDQTLMYNDNLSYLQTFNTKPLTPVSAFQLTSGVWQINSINGTIPSGSMATMPTTSATSMSVPAYGISTQQLSIPSTITDQGGMRVSAAVRIYLPLTCDGTYTINLYATIGGRERLVVSNSQILACFVWNDLQVVWSIPEGETVDALRAEILQTNEFVTETMYVTMLSAFYNPISWSWTTDKINYSQMTSTINDQNGFTTLNFVNSSSLETGLNTFFIRAKAHESGAWIKSVFIAPKYPFDPYTPSANVNYMPDPRTNEDPAKVFTANQPMFFLSNNYFPEAYQLANTSLAYIGGKKPA
jgi:hypothetical protein